MSFAEFNWEVGPYSFVHLMPRLKDSGAFRFPRLKITTVIAITAAITADAANADVTVTEQYSQVLCSTWTQYLEDFKAIFKRFH